MSTRFSQILRSLSGQQILGLSAPVDVLSPVTKKIDEILLGGQATGAQNSPLQIRARCPAAHLSVPAEILRAQGSYNNQPFGPFFSWSFKAGTPKLCNFAVLLVKNGYRYLVSLFELVLFTYLFLKKSLLLLHWSIVLLLQLSQNWKLWSTVTLLADISYILSNSRWFKSIQIPCSAGKHESLRWSSPYLSTLQIAKLIWKATHRQWFPHISGQSPLKQKNNWNHNYVYSSVLPVFPQFLRSNSHPSKKNTLFPSFPDIVVTTKHLSCRGKRHRFPHGFCNARSCELHGQACTRGGLEAGKSPQNTPNKTGWWFWPSWKIWVRQWEGLSPVWNGK